MTNNELRNRKSGTAATSNNKKKSKGDDKKKAMTATAGNAPRRSKTSHETQQQQQPETLWNTFTSHPLVTVMPYILIPYLLYKSMFVMALRKPEVMKGIIDLRPAVSMDQPRQVLILGAIGSGTKQLTEGLSKIMKLEVDHEAMNTLELFARDGTVSNFLGIRYAPDSYARDRLSSMLSNTCFSSSKASGSSFSVRSYQPSACWPWPVQNRTCAQRECIHFVGREFGCGLAAAADKAAACSTPFARVLFLTRHPLHILQLLQPKICPTGKNATATKAMHPAVRQMAGVYMPDETADSTCFSNLAWYVVEYHRAMLDALKQGRVDAVLQYEETTLCEVAQVAGFVDAAQAVYAPNVAKVNQQCQQQQDDEQQGDVHKALPLLETKSTDQTMPQTLLQWDDLEAVGGSSLVKALKELCRELTYDPMALYDNGSAESSKTEGATKKAAIKPEVETLPPGETY